MTSFIGRLARATTRYRDDASGNVAITFALIGGVMMIAIGAAVDMGRWLNARDQTVAAIDAAVLAGGRSLQTNSTDKAAAVAAAEKFYDENVTSRLPVVNDSVTFSVNSDGMGMKASGTAYIKTPFLRFVNIEKLPLISTSQADFQGGSQLGMQGKNTEISVMLDITGSMSGQKLEDLKDAASQLVNIVVLDNPGKYSVKVALVPFSEDIRLPSAALTKARATPAKSKKVGNTTYYPSDCVVERTGAQKYTDATPGANAYVLTHFTSNYTGSSTKKGVCSIPSNGTVQPLTTDKQLLLSKIDGLTAAGGTAGQLGTAWAWYTLSPNWKTLWPAANQPAAYGAEDLSKVAILMTDGEYNTQYDANGIAVDQNKTNCPNAANGCATNQARSLCTAMKAAGITVYTIGFDIGGTNTTAYQTLLQCASDPTMAYNAEDGDQLKQAYYDIGLKLAKLYLSK